MESDVLLDEKSISVEVVRLWQARAPQAVGDDLLDQPMLSVHLPETGNGCGVIVCPGGGYRTLASDHEGLQVARWLNREGIAAFVLRYRLGPTYHSSVSLLDGERAVRYVRAHAEAFGVSSERIGMLGFSAGGHLTCAVANANGKADPASDDVLERVASRPDFIVPVYAVTNGAKRGRKADEYHPVDEGITAESPPAFIVTTHEDSVVPASQSTLLYDAMLAAGVSAELHIFNDGDHGLGLMAGDPDAGQWKDLLLRWLRRRGFLTSSARVGVEGTLLIDDNPPGLAWVTLLPEEEGRPLARTRVRRADGGAFNIPVESGPTEGWYEMQIHHVSEQSPPAATGVFTLPDARLYRERIRITADQTLTVHLASHDFGN